MGQLFAGCSQVLDQNLVPLHYRALTAQSLRIMGMDTRLCDLDLLAEDVREKMLVPGRHSTIYTGKPDCLAAKRGWFFGVADTLSLFREDDCIHIPGNASSGIQGTIEALMRLPHMIAKHTSQTNPARISGAARGLVIEAHVADWFRAHGPAFFVAPDNAGQWTVPCDHDFKLKIGTRLLKVDIAGPRIDGSFGRSAYKSPVNLHLLCQVKGQGVEWTGVVRGEEFEPDIMPENILSPRRMSVWLNCLSAGLDYNSLSAVANERRAA